jgi:hypothetical protein
MRFSERNEQTIMKTRDAVFLTIALFLLTSIVGFDFGGKRVSLYWFMVVGTTLWAALDSHKIQLRRYQSGIGYRPVVLFIAISFLWVIGFPWYLAMRYKIKTGAAALKDDLAKTMA